MKQHRRIGIGLLSLVLVALAMSVPVAAQSGNLLQDPGFEGPYVSRGRPDLNTPAAWPLYAQQGPTGQIWENRADHLFAFPHCTAPQVLSAPCSLNLNGGFVTWNAGVFQQVAVPEDANVVGSTWAWVQTCNSRDSSNNFVGFACGSSPASGVSVRVGIDPNGGTNPFDPAVVWGPAIAPHDRWEQARVEATANGGLVTFWIFTSQEWPSDFNNRWYDNAELYVGGAGGVSGAGPGQTAPGAAPTPRPTAALPVRQPPAPNGDQYHVVQYGDTLSGIAVIYNVPLSQVLELNDLTMATARNVPLNTRLLVRRAG
jgi:hypothetical protein